MKKVKNRALSILILVAAVILGLAVYVFRFATDGREWVSAPFNATVFDRGILTVGTITDRNGVILADIEDGGRIFAEDSAIRRAMLHAVGDLHGNIGTGALTVFAPELMGYNVITGAYSRTGAGRTISLTLDSRINVAALNALGNRNGAVMVMNYRTGEVLAMVSSPTFDPNSPPVITEDDDALDGVFINRAVSAAYTPGSTFKILTAAAAIERIPDVFEREFNCTGSFTAPDGGVVNCVRAHGRLNLADAFAVSCNGVFGQLAIELGADTLAEYVARYGLIDRAAVGRITTAAGNFDRAAANTADLAWSGIGQYTNLVCPAAMLRFVGAIANDGVAVDMSLLQRGSSAGTSRIMNAETAARLSELMDHHTEANFPGLMMRAKSGTAEVGGDLRPHAWFAGYIANEGFPYAFVVVIENGGGGLSQAGPVANSVLQAAIRG